MGATRLPGKVLLPLGGVPLLQRKIERVARAKNVQGIKVLSTVNPVNEIIEDLCHRIGCPVFRGSEEDVLDRIIKGTNNESPEVIVQLTGDNPLVDPVFIDESVEYLLKNNFDLVSNSLTQRTLIGLNIRCFKRSALLIADQECSDPLIRVHGGYYIQKNPDRFKIGENFVHERFHTEDIRLTVDEPRDYELVRRVFETLYPINSNFSADDILGLFSRFPEWKAINGNVRQKRPGEG
ncbi:MAG: acylneuraminate cytidylyltransferase [Alphaproteobacteria bacterium]|nr:acylneuraminate cytidylyltransferase [Alphaproteobacteria bacterium]